jgi:hypothetical protein
VLCVPRHPRSHFQARPIPLEQRSAPTSSSFRFVGNKKNVTIEFISIFGPKIDLRDHVISDQRSWHVGCCGCGLTQSHGPPAVCLVSSVLGPWPSSKAIICESQGAIGLNLSRSPTPTGCLQRLAELAGGGAGLGWLLYIRLLLTVSALYGPVPRFSSCCGHQPPRPPRWFVTAWPCLGG